MAIYHFSRTRVSETQVPHRFCHHGTTEMEIGNYLISKELELTKLKYLVIFFFFFFLDYWQININKKCVYLISKVLELSMLEYLVNFLLVFWDYRQININIKISRFFYVFIYLNRSIVKYRDFNFKILFFWDNRQIKHKIHRIFMFLFI